MTASALQPLGSNFDRFLYAPVGADRHGGLLSVISALARLGVDPWEHAAMLARLPVDGAARALSELLARLPAEAGEAPDRMPLANHLVSLLPRHAQPDEPITAFATCVSARAVPRRWRGVLLLVVLVSLLLVAKRLLAQ